VPYVRWQTDRLMAKARKATSLKLRFEIFKRDFFTCQYCGKTPPAVILEVDHIIPVCSGGKTTEENLVTACFDCNRGKGPGSLASIPSSLSERTAKLKEAEKQLRAYSTEILKRENRITGVICDLEEEFQLTFPKAQFSPSFATSVRINFVMRLTAEELFNAMEIAMQWARLNHKNADESLKYFCGICWKWMRGE
jgi:5-methylcytosine-specific restriction endonuclease McrA